MYSIEIESIGNNDYLSDYIKDCIKKVTVVPSNNDPKEAVLSETELMYYLLKIIYEIDRLKKKSSYASPVELPKIDTTITELRDVVKAVGSKLKTSTIFGEITENDAIERHPFVRSLTTSSMNGRTYEDAAKILCTSLGIRPIAFSQFAANNGINYPNIDNNSIEYSEGIEAARSDGTAASVAKAYRWAERNVEGKPGSVDNFIAGYLQAYKASNDEIDQERKKMLIKRYNGQGELEDKLVQKLNEMARNKEI